MTPFPLPAAQVLAGNRSIAHAPMPVAVLSGFTCASKSSVRGEGLSLATAGAAAAFTIQARDALGFAKENAGDPFEPLFTGEAPVAFSVADASSRSQGLSCGDVSGQGAEEYAATLLDADVASGDVTVTFKITGMTGIVPGSYIRIDAEVLRVTAVNEAVLSVSRAQDNTIAAAHPEGTTIWVSTSPAIQRFL